VGRSLLSSGARSPQVPEILRRLVVCACSSVGQRFRLSSSVHELRISDRLMLPSLGYGARAHLGFQIHR